MLLFVVGACGRVGFATETGVDGGVVAADGRPLDDAGQGDPTGHFVWKSAKATSAVTPLDREDLVNGIRGETWLEGGVVVERAVLLVNSLPSEFFGSAGAYEVTPAGWRITTDEATALFRATWVDPDHVILAWDSSAQGTLGTQRFETLTLERRASPPVLGGTRAMTSIRFPGSPLIPSGVCTDRTDAGIAGQIVTGAITIKPHYEMSTDFNFREFATPDCSGVETSRASNGFGHLELEGSQYRLFLVLDEVPISTAGTLTISSLLHFVRTSCAPAGIGCDTLPNEVTFTE